eukprot:TRINITY_DN1255_c0_g1_i4.p1 TRINITY_DN1255_c0_g1~~TRINITY_DN1255_c0_g1_i4.p1  ORF type:complete len:486 (+),score=147.50 TRINITY_DN1255_c0_g1_i4:32-1489(+)
MLKLRVVAVLLCLLASIEGHGHAHDHGHGHGHDEPPSFKWSKQANVKEDEIIEDDIDMEHIETIYGEGEAIDLNMAERHGGGHGHSHGGGHGHSHGGGHGHSHGGHNHGGHGHSHGPPQREPSPEERAKLRQKLHAKWDDDDTEKESEMGTIWFQAICATLLISAAPFFILFFIPLDNSAEKQWLLKILLAFASGGLLGDAFLHLIPHAQVASEGDNEGHAHSHSHSHSHSHGDGAEGHSHDMSVGLGVLSGVVAFLCVEKLVRIMKGGHSHSHSPPPQAAAEKDLKEKSKKKADEKKKDKKSDDEEEKESDSDKGEEKKEEVAKKEDDHQEEEEEEIKVSGYLNLAADCFHNFTDGLAIGASFLAGESIGLITTFTILLHEVPHEIGDFAILIQSGVPKQKAIFLQLLTAVGAMAGCIVSLVLGGVTEAASSITLPFTAGGFIYIATVSVLPELLEGSTFKQTVAEIAALLLGIYMMVIIAEYE